MAGKGSCATLPKDNYQFGLINRMKTIGKLLGWAWMIAFVLFIAAIFYRGSGHQLPDNIEGYRIAFENGLESFLGLWMFGVVFVAMWFLVGYQIGKDSGWKRLAESYENSSGVPVSDISFELGNGRVGAIPYANILQVGGHQFGLALKLLLPFRFGSPNLYIPWNDIDTIQLKKSMSPDKPNSFFQSLGRRLPGRLFAHVTLARFPDQVLILPWSEKLRAALPATLNLVQEDDLS